MNKLELENLLKHYDDLYYNKDKSEITDTEYDALKAQYIKAYGEYNYVPGEALFNKVEHSSPVLSLDKVQITDQEGIVKQLERLWPVVIEPKFDGLTLVTYSDKYVTRGNGKVGEDISHNMIGVKGLGKPDLFPIRSEVLMPHSEFKKINEERIALGLEPYENTRNAAAGMLRNKDCSKVQGLIAFAYDIMYPEEYTNLPTHEEVLGELAGRGWNITQSYTPTTIEEALNYINNFDRTKLDYDIDGLVVKHNGIKQFGMTGHHPKNAIAIKFQAEGEWTRINSVTWQVGKIGTITPVAEIEPVRILGSTISRVTLHNMNIVNALNIKINAPVFVVKANDVIPDIIECEPSSDSEDIIPPTHCPVCEGNVSEDENGRLICDNPYCEGQLARRVESMASRDAFDIAGLGGETTIKLLQAHKEMIQKLAAQVMNTEEVSTEEDDISSILEMEDWIRAKAENPHPSHIYDLSYEDILNIEGFAEKSARNLYDNIQKSLDINFDKFLYGVGFPGVGRRMSKDIAEFYYDPTGEYTEIERFVFDYDNDFNFLANMKGIGPETIKSLVKYYDILFIPFGAYDFNIKDVIPKKKAKEQMSFVITGSFEKSRKEIETMIKDAGHKVSSSVTSKTTYLLAAQGEESTVKYQKAIDLNTHIIHTLFDLQGVLYPN